MIQKCNELYATYVISKKKTMLLAQHCIWICHIHLSTSMYLQWWENSIKKKLCGHPSPKQVVFLVEIALGKEALLKGYSITMQGVLHTKQNMM